MGQTDIRSGRKCGAHCHNVIHQQDMAARNAVALAGMGGKGLCHIGKTAHTAPPVLTAGMAGAHQQIGAIGQPQFLRQHARQQRGLIIPPRGKAQPMQRHRGQKHIGLQHGPGRARHPARGGAGQIMPVMVFQPQHNLPPPPLIQQRRAPLFPWARKGDAVIAVQGCIPPIAGQGQAATVTTCPQDKRRLRPALGAKRALVFHLRIACHALRRIQRADKAAGQPMAKMACALALVLHLAPYPDKDSAMTQQPPDLTDRTALARHRARAGGDMFLHDIARAELQDRLNEVNRQFTNPAIVTGHPQVWADFLPSAVLAEDMPILPLAPGAHDLVVHVMSLHWASDPVGQLVQARRALCPDGLFLAVLPGGQTLSELRACLAQAEAEISGGLSPRVLPMAEIRDLGGLLQRAGFALPVADQITQQVAYTDINRLYADLRAMGERNALAARRRSFAPRALFARAAQLYTQHYSDSAGRLRASFDLVFLTGWAPDEGQPKPLRPGSAKTRLADVLGTQETPLPDTMKIPGKD